MADAVKEISDIEPTISTTGGTSDGRFISKLCDQVVEFGPINESIHKINENVYISDIEKLKDVYVRAREIAKRHECLMWAVSQASYEAEGKSIIDFGVAKGKKAHDKRQDIKEKDWKLDKARALKETNR